MLKTKDAKEKILSTLSFRCITLINVLKKRYIPAFTLLSCRIRISGTEEMKGFPAGSPAFIHWISFHASG